MADVDPPRPVMKSSGYEVDETLVGSLFHCLSVGGKNICQRAGWFALA